MMASKPGELVVCTLLRQFTSLAKSKIEKALEERCENNLMKSMRLSDDVAFEQLLDAFYVSAEFALPSLLKAVIQWYQSQHSSGTNYASHRRQNYMAEENTAASSLLFIGGNKENARLDTAHKTEKAVKCSNENQFSLKTICINPSDARVLAERRDLAIDIVFCQVLLSLLRQLSYHPGHNDQIELILDQSFRRFKYREDLQPQNSENVNLVADLYAEIVGVLSQSRFALVRSRFMRHLNELRAKESSPNVKPSIVSLIMGMKFFRVKMHPIEDFVNCFTFLQELGQYFLEVKEPEIKHVLSDLFVEILLPVAAVARQEVNIPALKNFVENLYPTSLELANKKKHVPALFPLVTCLLCVGTKSFFLNNWANFMTICLSQLKNRTPKVALVSLQSLSCLLWVYIVRIRGEKHSETQTKLHHIVNSLFPKNQKFVVPKDAPINIFVRIIQFIAHEKLEFAVKEIIIDRLGVNGLQKTLFMPERMNIGLCAFLLIAYGLQQKAGAPPMPQQSIGGGGLRQTVIKRSFHGTNLNDALGQNLGIQNYLIPVRRAFELILRQLDTQVCRVMMLPKQDVSHKEMEELMTAERKPKLDLLKTCVACIPRLLPNDMTKPELLELLAKVCLHVDEDLRKMAQQAMANLIVELPAFRVKTIQVFIQFIQKNVSDTSPQQLDSCLKTLFHLLNNWKLALQKDGAVSPSISEKSALYEAEGFALVMLCHCRSITRRLAVHILRKCRALLNLINAATAVGDPAGSRGVGEELCCIDVLDRSVPRLLERVLPLIPISERAALTSSASIDFSVLAERCSPVWLSGSSPTVPYPAVVVPTNFVSSQYSSLMPVNELDRGPAKDVSDQLGQRAPYPSDLQCSPGVNKAGQVGDGHKAMTSSLYDRSNSPTNMALHHDDRRPDQGPVHAATFPHSPGVFRRASQNQHHHQHHQQHPVQHGQQAYIVQPVPERVILSDVWATCLAVSFAPDNLATACPMAVKYAWTVLFQRISQLFPIIDPSVQIVENRASSILRSSSKKPTMEREQFFPLWHNYAVVGCCIAPSYSGTRISAPRDTRYQPGAPTGSQSIHASGVKPFTRLSTPPSSADMDTSCTRPGGSASQVSSASNTASVSPDSKANPTPPPPPPLPIPPSPAPSITKETARDLVKLLVPLLRCEQPEIRDSAVGALGRINPMAFRDALEELHPLLKESVDRKQENVRRRRRRDGLRASLIRVLALMSQNGVFAYPESNALTAQGCLISQLSDYLDGIRMYFESVADQAVNPTYSFYAGSSLAVGCGGTSSTTTGSSLGSAVITAGGIAAAGSNTPLPSGGSASVGAASAAAASAASVPNPVLTEAHLLVEMRLHLCMFLFELIRQLPKDKRTQLLPTAMRHQLFLLLSHWSGFHDHVMGLYPDPDNTVSSVVMNTGNLNTLKSGHTNLTVNQSTGSGASVLSDPNYSLDSGQASLDSLMPTTGMMGTSPTSSTGPPINIMTESTSSSVVSSVGGGVLGGSGSMHGTHLSLDSITRLHSIHAQDTWELRLWTDLMWLANQAMGALTCCGPIYDQHALFSDLADTTSLSGSDYCSSLGEKTTTNPSPGYILRWVSGLLVARDVVLSASPWLWHCPVVDASMCHVNLTPAGTASGYGMLNRASILAGGTGRERRLDSLLRQLGEETLTLLLDLNQASRSLLNWVIDQCYTANNVALSNACFCAISRILGNIPDFPCDFTSLLTLAMVHLDHPQKSLSDRAARMLQVLYFRFIIKPGALIHEHVHSSENIAFTCSWDQDPSVSPLSEQEAHASVCVETKMNLQLWRSIMRWSPTEVVRQFAAQHPDFTLPIFSELTRRMETARDCLRVPLLRLLMPWIINVELIDLIGDDYVKPSGLFDNGQADGSDTDHICQTGKLENRQKPDAEPEGLLRGQNRDKEDDDEEDDDDEEEDEDDEKEINGFAERVPVDAGGEDNSDECADVTFLQEQFTRKSINSRSADRPGAVPRAFLHKRVYPRLDDDLTMESDPDSDSDPAVDSFGALRNRPISFRTERTKAKTLPRESDGKFGSARRWHTDSTRKPNTHLFRAASYADFWSTVPPTLRSDGWGSKQATELVLNNLFYLTLRLAECPAATECIKQLWLMLIRYRPANLHVILRYLIVITSVAPATLLLHVKRLVTYLACEKPESVMEELMVEMQTIDGIGLTVERTTKVPFFRITTNASRARDSKETTTVEPVSAADKSQMSEIGRSGAGGDVGSGISQSVDAPEPSSIQAVLQAVTRESASSIDPEMVAIGLAATAGAKPDAKPIRSRGSALPFFHSKRHAAEETTGGASHGWTSRRPKSATSHPSPRPAVSQSERPIDSSMALSSSSAFNQDSLPTVPDACGDGALVGSGPHQSIPPLTDADGDVELDVDMTDTRELYRFSPEDKYATLRAKDFTHLLSLPDAKDGAGASETEMYPDERRTDLTLRRGTLPSTEDSRERYYQVAALQTTTEKLRFGLKETRRCKTKTRSQPRTGVGRMKVSLHTVSLPPNLTGLAPLPLPLPSGVPSLPSLWLTSIPDKLSAGSSGSSPRNTWNRSSSKAQTAPGSLGIDGTPVNKSRPQPLLMPVNGGYQAPLGKWLTEPLVIGGSVVYTGSWPLTGARSPLVLLLVGGLTQCASLQIDWNAHMPLLLLCVLLGMDHCRALIQEECKQLLVSLLSLTCPEQDALRLLRLELEANLVDAAHPSSSPGPRKPRYRLTMDGGPYRERFDLFTYAPDEYQAPPAPPQPPLTSPSSEHASSPPKKPERRFMGPSLTVGVSTNVTHSPPGDSLLNRGDNGPTVTTASPGTTAQSTLLNGAPWTGSTFSLISTTTLIPGKEESLPRGNHVVPVDRDDRAGSPPPTHVARSSSPGPVSPPTLSCAKSKSAGVKKPRPSLFAHKPSAGPIAEVIAPIDPKPLQMAVEELRELLLSSSGQALWTWEDFNLQRFQQATTQDLTHLSSNVYTTASNNRARTNAAGTTEPNQPGSLTSVERLVRLVARILALSVARPEEAEQCLRCHHGPRHSHISRIPTALHRSSTVSGHCMVARLSQSALSMGLSCPNRHYASRSLQIFRILGAHLDTKSLSRLVARLGETIADPNEELQGYVAELFLTQEAAIQHLGTKGNGLDSNLALPGQTRTAPTSPNCVGRGMNAEPGGVGCVGGHTQLVAVSDRRRQQQRHSTSTNAVAVTVASNGALVPGTSLWSRPVGQLSPRLPPQIVDDTDWANESMKSSHHHPTNMAHSGPKATINQCRLSAEEQEDLICGIFWTAVFLLESNFEHEYLAGVRLLTNLVPSVVSVSDSVSRLRANSVRSNLGSRADKLLAQMHLTPPFPGILSLAIKGCSSASLIDPACRLLVTLIPFLASPLVVPPGRHNHQLAQLSYPIMLLTLMPMLLTAWDEDPTTSGPTCSSVPDSCTTDQQQPSVLQGGFLGRGICGSVNTNTVPRALGSWTLATQPRNNTNTTCSPQAQALRLGRADSIGTGMVGAFGAAGSGWNLANLGANNFPRNTCPTPLRPKNPICIQAADALAQAAVQLDSSRLSNLALILRLYANGTFSKEVDQWAKCVVCYLLEGYAQYTPQLLHHLTTLLTTGPVCIQMPLLKVACLFLEQVDLTNSELSNTLQQFITAVTSQFLGTECWPEITRILQVLVSRSAVLATVSPPSAYTLSGLDPSGSGRVLDLAAAAAAVAVPLPESEPPRMELAGPVVECQFNMLHEAPLLAPHLALPTTKATVTSSEDDTGVEDSADRPTHRGLDAPRVMLDLALDELFRGAASSWNRPGTCQARVRERLYRLVGCYGLPAEHRIGAPRSPSVIFSQSTETLDPQLSVHSSSETTSMIDVSNSDDIRLDETSSMEQAAVFRDLDTYLDAQLMNINFLGVPDCRLASTSEDEPRRPWGVRGQSITCHTDFTQDPVEQVTDLLPTMRIPLEQSTVKSNTPSSSNATRQRNRADNDCLDYAEKLNWTEAVPARAVPIKELHARPLLRDQQSPMQFTPLHYQSGDRANVIGEEESVLDAEEELNPQASCYDHSGLLSSIHVPCSELALEDHSSPAMTVSLYEPVSPSRATRRGRTSSGTSLLVAHSRCSPPGYIPRTTEIRDSQSPRNVTVHSPTHSQSSVVSAPVEMISFSLGDSQLPSVSSPREYHFSDAEETRLTLHASNAAGDTSMPRSRTSPGICSSSPPFLTPSKPDCGLKRPGTLMPVNTLNGAPIRPALRTKIPQQYHMRLTKVQSRLASIPVTTQLANHRSLSTSNLTGNADVQSVDCTGSLNFSITLGQKVQPHKQASTSEVATVATTGRFQPPLLKFHKNFTNKRQSCSAEDLPQLIKQPKVSFLVPMKTDESEITVDMLSQETPRTYNKISTLLLSESSLSLKDSTSSLHSPTTDCSTSNPSRNDPPKEPIRFGPARCSASLPEPESLHCAQTATQRSPVSITPAVYHKLQTRTSILASVTYPWTETTSVEKLWLHAIKAITLTDPVEGTADEGVQTNMDSVWTPLPSVFSALSARCQNGVRAALNLAGCSWDETGETARLISAAEILATGMRPPCLFYSFEPNVPVECEWPALHSELEKLLKSYEETVVTIQQLANLASDRDSTAIQRGCVALLSKLVSFLETAHTALEELRRAWQNRRTARDLEERLQLALDRLVPALSRYTISTTTRLAHSSTPSPEYANAEKPADAVESENYLIDLLDVTFLQLTEFEDASGSDKVSEPLVTQFIRAINLYRNRLALDPNQRWFTIDCILGMFGLYVKEKLHRSSNSDTNGSVVYLTVPIIVGCSGNQTLLEHCSYLKQQLNSLG